MPSPLATIPLDPAAYTADREREVTRLSAENFRQKQRIAHQFREFTGLSHRFAALWQHLDALRTRYAHCLSAQDREDAAALLIDPPKQTFNDVCTALTAAAVLLEEIRVDSVNAQDEATKWLRDFEKVIAPLT